MKKLDEPVVSSDADYSIVESSVSESSFEFSSCKRELQHVSASNQGAIRVGDMTYR